MNEYVSDRVKAGSAAFYNRFPRDFCHALQEPAARKPIISKQILDVQRYLQTKRNVLLSNNVCQPIMFLITKWIPELTSCYALRFSQGRLGRALRTSVCVVGFQPDFIYEIDFFFRPRGSHIGSECIAW